MPIAVEGIVNYSFSGSVIDVGHGYLSTPLGVIRATSFNSLINDGRIRPIGNNLYIDFSDIFGSKYKNTEKLVLSKDYIETLDLIGEGEMEGLVSGEYIFSGNLNETGYRTGVFSGYSISGQSEGSGWLRSIYYNQVPILSERGQLNFQAVNAAFVVGKPNGDNLHSLLSEETSSRSIGERIRGGPDNEKYYRISNKNCKGVIVNIRIPALSLTQSDGDVGRTKIDWQISYRPIFGNITKKTDFSSPISETVFGKITTVGGYIQSTRVDFDVNSFFSQEFASINSQGNTPQVSTATTQNYFAGFINNPNFLGWEIKIKRVTEDATSSFIQDVTYIDSITELYGSQFNYPNSAIVKNLFNAEFFSSVPERAFDVNLLKIKIPGNYNPINRTYSQTGFATTNGSWNGEFATGKKWSNNPAWCFYDILTNKRYGLGRYINELNIDKFSLYEIGQYCDQLVFDSNGGLEPRFTCNVLLTDREDAYTLINNMASIFRGMVYYTNGNLYSVGDLPKEPRVTFTNSNTEEGDFNYSSTSRKTRQSVALVRFNDPNNFYQPAIEYIEDPVSIRRYGIRELDMTAFGCTSRGQAIRLGRWALLTNNNESETVEFVGGIEAASLRPGDVFKIVDYNRKSKKYGGRLYSINDLVTGATVILDSNLSFDNTVQYKLSVLTPSYYYDSFQVTGINSSDIPNIRRSFLQNILFSGNQTSANSDNRTVIGLTTGFNKTEYVISGNPIYSIELGPLSQDYTGARYFTNYLSDHYRALNIEELDVHRYKVVGLQYWNQKFIEIDSGINYQRPKISSSFKTPSTPRNLVLSAYNDDASNDSSIIHYSFLIDNYNYINNYKVYVTTGAFSSNGVPDDSDLASILPADILQSVYKPNYSGEYKFRVYSHNEIDNIYSSSYASGSIEINKGLDITNVIITSLQLKDI